MKPKYSIPENESLTDLLEVIMNPTKLKERVQGLSELLATIKAETASLMQQREIQETLQTAQGKLAKANQVIAEADKYATGKKAEADAYFEANEQLIKGRQDAITVEVKNILARENKASDLEASLTKWQETITEDRKEADAVMTRAKALMEDALRLQSQYELKLSQFKQLAEQ